jgi:hypothetical protein
MVVTISAQNPRSIRAVEIAVGAASWIRCRTKDGRKLYAVPSRSVSGLYHLVDCQACDCMDARRHPGQPCMHVLAVRLHCELAKVQPPQRRESASQGKEVVPAL